MLSGLVSDSRKTRDGQCMIAGTVKESHFFTGKMCIRISLGLDVVNTGERARVSHARKLPERIMGSSRQRVCFKGNFQKRRTEGKAAG